MGSRGTTRRRFLAGAAVLGLAAPHLLVRRVEATPEEAAAAIKAVTGDAPVRPGRVKLEVPPIAENGNSVPLTVTVDSPMTASDHVKSLHLFAPENPLPNVAHFSLGPRAGKAQVGTRIRLARSQRLVAVAALSDGSFWSDTAEIVIALAACIENEL